MKNKIKKINQSVDGKIRNICEKMPEKRRKLYVLILCFLFTSFFIFSLIDAFQSEGVKEMMKIEHITPLDLPQDTLIQRHKEFTNEK
jgi:TRAP-type C4-dicarboxylate transport system permease small subunit